MPETREPGPLSVRREAAFSPTTWNADRNTVELAWSVGARVTRMDFWTGEKFGEELGMDAGNVDLSRLEAGAPLLNTHQQWDLSSQIGVVERAWLQDGEGRAEVRFSNRPEVQSIVQDVRDGIIRNVSVGYRVDQWLDVTTSSDPMPVRRAVKWTPMELSLVPVPADPGAQVRAAGAVPTNPAAPPAMPTPAAKATAMPDPVVTAPEEIRAAPALPAPAPVATQTSFASIAELRALQQRSGLADGWVLDQLSAGVTLDAAREAAIDALAATRRAPQTSAAPSTIVTRDERDTRITRMADALTARRTNTAPEEHAREFMGLGLHGLMRELLISNGERNVHRLDGSQLFEVMSTRNIQSSSDFAAILVNSSNKFLRQLYEGQAQTWKGWTNEIEVADFKTITSAGMGNFPEPGAIAENQAVPIGALTDEGETYKVQERSVRVMLSRIAIVNDDMRAIDRAINNAALGSYTQLRRQVFGILTTNANMADGNALFSSAHANLDTTAAVPSTTRFKAMRTLLTSMVGVDGQPLPPPMAMVFLVGAKNEGTAFELISPLIVPTAVGGALPTQYRAMTSVIADPFVTGTTEPYFLTRTDVPSVEIAYLTGQRTPQIIQDTELEYTGVGFRVDFNFGVKATSWRGIAKNAGA